VRQRKKSPGKKKRIKKARSRKGDWQKDTEEGSKHATPQGPLLKPKRSVCHSFFITVQIAAILANISMIAIQIVPLILGKLKVLDIVLRCYFGLFSLFFIISELELSSAGAGNWIIRGFLYTFLGVVAMEQQTAIQESKFIPKDYWTGPTGVWMSLVLKIATLWIIGIGCLYFFLGLCCMKQVRNRCRDNYQGRRREYKEQLKG